MSISTREDVVFATVDGRELRMNLAWPQDPPTVPMPVVVWVHGGGWNAGDHTGLENLPLAARGYFTANIEYRLSYEAVFPAQIHDCKAAVRYLRAHAEQYRLDPARIGVWGASAGGHLSALLATSAGVPELEGDLGYPEQSSEVQAVVDYCGPTDLTLMLQGQPEEVLLAQVMNQFLGGPLAQRRDLARSASPVAYIGPATPPFLIIHGDNDEIVPFSQSRLLDALLHAAGRDSTLIQVKSAGHDLVGDPGPERLLELSIQFFDKHLKQ